MTMRTSKLAAMLRKDSVPQWVTDAMDRQREKIVEALREKKDFDLGIGPHGQKLVLRTRSRRLF